MTTHNPLVRISGKIVELPAADNIGGAPAGADGTDGIDGGAITIKYTFDTTTTDADPGAGKLRLNNATQNSATSIYADLTDALGSDWTSAIDTFDDSTNTIKGSIRLVKSGDASKFLTFNVTAVTSASGYRKITVSNTASSASSPFANGDTILLCFDRAGDAGSDGSGADMVLISSVTTSGSQSTVTFSSIPGTYKHLQIDYICRDTASGSGLIGLWLQMNSDNTSSNYTSEQFQDGFGSTNLSGTDAAGSNGAFAGLSAGTSGLATAFATGTIWINGYAQTTFHKMVQFNSAAYYSGPATRVRQGMFVWKSTSAITTLKFTSAATAFLDGSIFSLYGKT